MPTSQAIVVLGMHRSGTSVLTRGLQGLGINLGDDFLGSQPDNPTGYWEDKGIVSLNERLLAILGLNWESISLIDGAQWLRPEVESLRNEAAAYLQSRFMQFGRWGFKDPRTVRLLPFWRAVFQKLGVDDRYVVAIRTPLGVATSLLRRQNIAPATSHMLSLVYLVPFLNEIAGKPFVVTDYDLLIADPRAQLERIARALQIPLEESSAVGIEQFSRHFLDPGLRHGYFSRHDFDTIPEISPLVREAYLWLYQLATDQMAPDAPEFWEGWKNVWESLESLISRDAFLVEQGINLPLGSAVATAEIKKESEPAEPAKPDRPVAVREPSPRSDSDFRFSERPMFPGAGINFFVVIGAQRTGTNLLREVLNTNDQIAMLGEVLSPSTAPAHWENFLRTQPEGTFPTANFADAEALLDRYFQFVHYRIRNHWSGGDKQGCRSIGVDIKYNQLRQLDPENWSLPAPPFLLSYLKARGAVLIHTTRRNVIHCAISALIAAQRNLWHNYEGAVIDRRYFVDAQQCLAYANTIVTDRDAFLANLQEYRTTECYYEELIKDIARVPLGTELPEAAGPLMEIAKALGVPYRFRDEGRLRKSINVPYSRLLLNHEALSAALRDSEFSAFAASLSDNG